jgi:GxxExxY protein
MLYEELTYKIRGAFYEVYNTLGPGFKEEIYHRALAKEFRLRKIPFVEKKRLIIMYKNEKVGIYEPDFIVDEKVLVEIKSVSIMPKIFETQLYYYLKGSHYKLGFLVNFGAEKLDMRRRIFETARNPRSSA